MLLHLKRLGVDEAGEVAISYSLIAALVSIAALVVMAQLGDTLPRVFNLVTQTMIEGLARVGLI
jgi:Flp pilus assembly pilin Flp